MSETLIDSLRIDLETDQPLAVQLANQLTWLIASNQIPSGGKLPPVRTLASQLGINLHTVRAAYRKLEENGLVVTRQGMGSTVLPFDSMHIAGNATSLPTHTVGVIVPDAANPFYPAVVQGIIQVASEHHILVINCDTQDSALIGQEYLSMLVAKRVDGLIIAPYGLRLEGCAPAGAGQIENCPVPIVYLDRPEVPGYGVLLDAEGAGYTATRHMIEHGHKRVAMITGNRESTTLMECYHGYLRALQECQIPQDPSIVFEANSFTFSAGYDAAKMFLDHPNPPKAIFAAGDMFAIGAIRAIRDRGLRIPEDVAIIGYNDIDVAAFTEPPLTTVRVPIRDLGVTSMQMLNRLITGEPVEPRKVTLGTQLVIRNSCGCHLGD